MTRRKTCPKGARGTMKALSSRIESLRENFVAEHADRSVEGIPARCSAKPARTHLFSFSLFAGQGQRLERQAKSMSRIRSDVRATASLKEQCMTSFRPRFIGDIPGLPPPSQPDEP